ncbi:MAG TPA: sigma-70 family RNA polymerase sigma factor, partial [Tepidisphaeraceae bacterium]
MNDSELLGRYISHRDSDAMAEIVRRYGGLVLGAAQRVTGNKHDAEDVAQACFVELSQKAARVNENLAGFLHCLATRRGIDLVRRRKARSMNEAAAPRPDETAAADHLWHDIQADLDAALAGMDEADRLPIVQHYLLGRSQQEVADDLKINQSTVARRLAKGLQELRKRLGGSAAALPDATLLAFALTRHAPTATPEAFVSTTMAALSASATTSGTAGTGTFIGTLFMKKAALFITAFVILTVLAGAFVVMRGIQQKTPAQAVSPATAPAQAASAGDEQAFFAAVNDDDVEAVRVQLKLDRTLARSQAGQRGETPLHRARSVEVAKLLLEAGADPNARDTEFNARPVRWQINRWRSDVAAFLEGIAGADDDAAYEAATGNTARFAGRLASNPDLPKTRLSKDVLGTSNTLLHVAAQYGQPEVCELLLRSGADVNAGGAFHNAPALETAAWAGYPQVIKVL